MREMNRKRRCLMQGRIVTSPSHSNFQSWWRSLKNKKSDGKKSLLWHIWVALMIPGYVFDRFSFFIACWISGEAMIPEAFKDFLIQGRESTCLIVI
jgi:hypothetical protein